MSTVRQQVVTWYGWAVGTMNARTPVLCEFLDHEAEFAVENAGTPDARNTFRLADGRVLVENTSHHWHVRSTPAAQAVRATERKGA